MKALADLFLSAVELVEAEGRDLRRWALRVGVSLSLVLAAVLLGTLGVLALNIIARAFFRDEIQR